MVAGGAWGALPGSLQLGSPFLGAGTLFKDQEMRPVLLSGGVGELTAPEVGRALCCLPHCWFIFLFPCPCFSFQTV